MRSYRDSPRPVRSRSSSASRWAARLERQDRDLGPRRAYRPGAPVLVLPLQPGRQGGQVGGQRLGGGQAGDDSGADLPGGGHRPVAQDGPSRRVGHRQPQARPEVGLVQARPGTAGVGGLEVGVEVGGPVHRVGEAVQALPGVGVPADGLDDHLVLPRGQGGQPHPGAVPGHGHRRAVEHDAVHRLPQEVRPQALHVLAGHQVQRAAHGEARGPRVHGTGDVHVHVQDGHVDDLGAPPGLLAGQVGGAGQACGRDGEGHEGLGSAGVGPPRCPGEPR